MSVRGTAARTQDVTSEVEVVAPGATAGGRAPSITSALAAETPLARRRCASVPLPDGGRVRHRESARKDDMRDTFADATRTRPDLDVTPSEAVRRTCSTPRYS